LPPCGTTHVWCALARAPQSRATGISGSMFF
jgi:hypothetical protein